MIISMAWTSAAFLSGRKHCTRRSWNASYAAHFHKGQICDSYNRNPRNGGKKIGSLRLISAPYLQYTHLMTEQDYEDEGLRWMEENNILIRGLQPRQFFDDWKTADEEVYVVRFDPILVDPAGLVCTLNKQIALPLF